MVFVKLESCWMGYLFYNDPRWQKWRGSSGRKSAKPNNDATCGNHWMGLLHLNVKGVRIAM